MAVARKAKAESAATPAPAKADKKKRRLSPEKTPVLQALQASDFANDSGNSGNQLILFDL
jgi:hypothetical protein